MKPIIYAVTTNARTRFLIKDIISIPPRRFLLVDNPLPLACQQEGRKRLSAGCGPSGEDATVFRSLANICKEMEGKTGLHALPERGEIQPDERLFP
jgi:hypothetical protein